MSRRGTRRDHRRFCEIEGWSVVVNSRGRPTSHHLTYGLAVDDGRILRTRISRPANATEYGRRLWNHILTDQLDVTEIEFWQCVDHRKLPARGGAVPDVSENALPLSLVRQLVDSLHLGSDEIAELSMEDALTLMTEYWSRPDR